MIFSIIDLMIYEELWYSPSIFVRQRYFLIHYLTFLYPKTLSEGKDEYLHNKLIYISISIKIV